MTLQHCHRQECKQHVDALTAELLRLHELLTRAENEMRYAGWDKFESDNTARNGMYEQVKHFLEKNT